MTSTRETSVFGRRREPHTIIIARGDTIRHFTMRPWMVALAGSVLAAFAVGYLMATSYLVLRDDLIGASNARQARLQQAYEDRISALRAQVDRITSRQLLDQQLMETRVSELLERQARLADRSERLRPILERATATGTSALPPAAPLPDARPDRRASMTSSPFASMGFERSATAAPTQLNAFATMQGTGARIADESDRIFVAINSSLRTIETDQITHLRTLAEGAYETAEVIGEALREAGLPLDTLPGQPAAGGPLIAVGATEQFDEAVEDLDQALSALQSVREAAMSLPVANPAPGRSVTSSFGIRRDPLIGRRAFHAGIDFRAETGHPIRTAGAGTVVKAGWNGGYGRMIEIDHGKGLTTRYAHLSRISVSEGDTVESGTVIGRAGNTGRSTGPHLHYEVRIGGEPVNPLRLLKAGRKIQKLL